MVGRGGRAKWVALALRVLAGPGGGSGWVGRRGWRWSVGEGGVCSSEKPDPHPALRASLSRFAGEGLLEAWKRVALAPLLRSGRGAAGSLEARCFSPSPAKRERGCWKPGKLGRASCRERGCQYV